MTGNRTYHLDHSPTQRLQGREPNSLWRGGNVLDRYLDLRRMQQRVVDQAMVHGFLYSCPVQRVEPSRHFDFNVKMGHARRILLLLCANPHPRTLCGQLVLAEVLRGIERGTRSQRCQQQFWRRHAFVVATAFPWLIRHDHVASSLDFKLHSPKMFDDNFHRYLRSP